MPYKVLVQPVAGKYKASLVREEARDSQLNRYSLHKPGLVTVISNRRLYATPEAAEEAMQGVMSNVLQRAGKRQ